MIVSNLRMLLTKAVFRFWTYSFIRMLIFALCSLLRIKSHLMCICTFLLSHFIPRATRKPLLKVNLCTMPEIVRRLKLLAKRVTNSGNASGFAVIQSGFYSLYSGRLNTLTEPSGSLVNANPAAVAW